MARLLFLALISALGQDYNFSCFPSCEHQCTGLYGPREGPQERWTEVVEWVKKKSPTAYVDERIVMAPGRFGDQVTSAADVIQKGEILMKLPVDMFLLEEDCFPTEAFARLGAGYNSSLKTLPKHTWNVSRANGADFTQAGLCLLVHRLLGNESAYAGYINHLPRHSSTETYMFRNPADFEPMRGTDSYRVATVVKKRHTALLENATDYAFEMIHDYFPALNFTRDQIKLELQHTLSLCGSRTFNLDSDMLDPSNNHSKLFRPALVPLLDMLNHGDMRTRNCQYFFNTTGQYFQSQAIRDISPGEELVHSYGLRSNAELLLFYGFMMPGNIEDSIGVADFAAGAIELNYQARLGRDLRCHTPYFRALEGTAWPPKYQSVVQNASAGPEAATVYLGPLKASVYHSFKERLDQPHTEQLRTTFAELAENTGDAILKVVSGDFVVTHTNTTQFNQSVERGNLTVELVWKGSPRHSSCEPIIKPRCEDFAPGISSVSAIVTRLQHGLLPGVARVGGCLIWSERKQLMYEIRLGSDSMWTGVVTTTQSNLGDAVEPDEDAPHEGEILEEFQFKRYLIRAAGLEEFSVKLLRNGLLQESLAAIRIAVLPSLSSLAIHSILSGNRFGSHLEQQVAKTIGMFCFEELTRRLQAIGVDPEEENFQSLLAQARAISKTEAERNYEVLARNELDILCDFCRGIAEWGLPIWY